MSWNEELKKIKITQSELWASEKAYSIYELLKEAVSQGYSGKTFGFHIEPEVGKILTEQGLGYKTYRESECDEFSFPFEESSVWIK